VSVGSIILTFAFIGVPYLYIALAAVSLACNVCATSAIGYRAWYVHSLGTFPFATQHHLLRQHRMFLHRHISAISHWASLQKMVDLLRETGAVYCLLWVRDLCTRAISHMY
jgi:hypothetical protein